MTWRTKIADRNFDIIPQEGSYITIDEWNAPRYLLHDDTDWEPCDFRIHAGGGLYHLAVRVKVTGQTLQPRPYSTEDWVRVRVVLVGDGSPDTELHGWMMVTERERVVNAEKEARIQAEWTARLERQIEAERRDEEARQAAEQAQIEADELDEKRRRNWWIATSRAEALEL